MLPLVLPCAVTCIAMATISPRFAPAGTMGTYEGAAVAEATLVDEVLADAESVGASKGRSTTVAEAAAGSPLASADAEVDVDAVPLPSLLPLALALLVAEATPHALALADTPELPERDAVPERVAAPVAWADASAVVDRVAAADAVGTALTTEEAEGVALTLDVAQFVYAPLGDADAVPPAVPEGTPLVYAVVVPVAEATAVFDTRAVAEL